jgi:threonine aldolase
MIRFECDYTEGAHPRIMEALMRTNMEQNPGYGLDVHCERARELIRRECGLPEAAVHFLVGGTQTNATVIAALLRPYQGVLCAVTGHINGHETGAVEATGHKILQLSSNEGKVDAGEVEAFCRAHLDDPDKSHSVQPAMVYISQPTELGTLYSVAELEQLHEVCRKYGLLLFADGARLGYGLAADPELSLAVLARLCDVFYIGGTKVGALFGEAVVFPDPELCPDFRYMIKRHGGMFAKGRLLGIQFETLFEDGLYYDISAHALKMAKLIRSALAERSIPLFIDSPTNQLFPVLTDAQRRALAGKYTLSHWKSLGDGRSVMRICTSWATAEENAIALAADIRSL